MSATFLQTVERVRRELPGTFAVCAERWYSGDRQEGIEASGRLAWNEDTVFPAASVIKIAVALEVLASLSMTERLEVTDADKVIGSGVLAAMDQRSLSVGDLIYLALAISDNTATNVLIERVSVPAINARLAGLGLVETRLTGKLISEGGEFSPTTAAELVSLLKTAATDPRLNALLERSQTASTIGRGLPDDRFPGVTEAPPTVTLAYKTGSIRGVIAEAGIVRSPRATYAIALLSQGSGDLRPNHANVGRVHLGELSRAVYEAFV